MANQLNNSELSRVSGGWDYANGSYVNYGSHIAYTVAPGDVLSGIAVRFNVTVAELQQWNNIANPDRIRAGQVLNIYARVLR